MNYNTANTKIQKTMTRIHDNYYNQSPTTNSDNFPSFATKNINETREHKTNITSDDELHTSLQISDNSKSTNPNKKYSTVRESDIIPGHTYNLKTIQLSKINSFHQFQPHPHL